MVCYKVIASRDGFQEVIDNGKKVVLRGFIFFVFQNDKYEQPHFGWIVSSKNGNAVARNRIKRRLRSLSKTLMEIFPESLNNCAICYIAKKQSYYLNYKIMQMDLVNAIEKSL